MAFFLFLFVLLPFTLILLIAWALTKNNNFKQLAVASWIIIIIIMVIGKLVQLITDKKELEKEDYYGEYIVNRDYFKGRQSDWQYEHFRFEIKENDSIYFYVTDKEKVIRTHTGVIQTTIPYES